MFSEQEVAAKLNCNYVNSIYNMLSKNLNPKSGGNLPNYQVICKPIKLKSHSFYYYIAENGGYAIADRSGRAVVVKGDGTRKKEDVVQAMYNLIPYVTTGAYKVLTGKWVRLDTEDNGSGLFASSRCIASALMSSDNQPVLKGIAILGNLISRGIVQAYYVPSLNVGDPHMAGLLAPEARNWFLSGAYASFMYAPVLAKWGNKINQGMTITTNCSAGFDITQMMTSFNSPFNLAALSQSRFGYFVLFYTQTPFNESPLAGIVAAEYFASMVDMTPFRRILPIVSKLEYLRDEYPPSRTKAANRGTDSPEIKLTLTDIYGCIRAEDSSQSTMLAYDTAPSNAELDRISKLLNNKTNTAAKPTAKHAKNSQTLSPASLNDYLLGKGFRVEDEVIRDSQKFYDYIDNTDGNRTVFVSTTDNKIDKVIVRYSGVKYGELTDNITPRDVVELLKLTI